MKKLLLSILLFTVLLNAKATDYYWVGTSTAIWGATSSWRTGNYSGGSSSTTTILPGASDIVHIGNNTNATVNMDANYSIAKLDLEGTGQIFINTTTSKSLTVTGKIYITNSNSTGSGTATIRMTGTDSLINTSTVIDHGKLPNLTFASGSNITLIGFITMGGSTTLTDSGTVSYGTSTLGFYYNNTIKGNIGLYNVQFQGNGGAFTISNTITINKNLKLSETSICDLNTGTIQLYGNLIDSNTSTSTTGSATLTMIGDSNQTYSFISGGALFNWVVNKTSGTVSPASGTTAFYVRTFELDGGTFTAPTGNFYIGVNAGNGTAATIFNHSGGTFNQTAGTVVFNPYANNNINTVNVISTTSFYNIEIKGTTPQYTNTITSASGDTVQVKNNFTHTSAYLHGMWNVGGNLIVNASASQQGSGTIILSGTASTTYSYTRGGRTAIVEINKSDTTVTVSPASGTINLSVAGFILNAGKFTAPPDTFSVGLNYGNSATPATIFNHIAGVFKHNNGLVQFVPTGNNATYTVNVISSTSFYNVEINGTTVQYPVTLTSATGDTVQIQNNLKHTSGYILGYWNVGGNLNVGASAGGGLGTFILSGSVSTTYSYVSGGRTAGVSINKSDTAATVIAASGTTDFYISAFILNAGKFTAPTGTFSIGPYYGNNTTAHTPFNHIGGKFYHNNGLTRFEPRGNNAIYTIDVLPSTIFYNVEINGLTDQYPVFLTGGTGDTIQVRNNLTHTRGSISGVFRVRGNLSVGASANAGFGTIILSDSTSSTYSYVSGGKTCILKISKSGTGSVTPASSPMDFAATEFILASGSFIAPSGTFSIGASFTTSATIFNHTGGTFNANSGTVTIAAMGGGSVILSLAVLSATQFYNLTYYGPPGTFTTTFTSPAGDTIHVNNNLYLQDGFIYSVPLLVLGNVTAASTFDGSTSELIFTGSNAQTFDLTGVTTLYAGKITINKSANNVTLLSALTLGTSGQTLSLKKGNLNTSTYLLTFSNGAIVTGASDSSFVDGPVKKVGNAAFKFPVGAGGHYKPISISAPGTTTDAFTAQYYSSGIADALDGVLTFADTCEHWNLIRNTGSSTVHDTLFWNSPCFTIPSTLSYVKIGYVNTSTWTSVGTCTTNGNATTGSVAATFVAGDLTLAKTNPLVHAHAGRDTTICSGLPVTLSGSVTGGTSPFTYSWSPASGLSSTTGATPTATPTVTTTYVLTVTDNLTELGKDTVVITIHPKLVVHPGADVNLCIGSNVYIGANPPATGGTLPYIYSWSPSTGLDSSTVGIPLASPTVTASYVLTVTDSNSCIAIDTINITLHSLPTAFAGRDTTIGFGNPFTMGGYPAASGGSSPYKYRWYPGTGLSSGIDAHPVAYPSGNTSYALVVTDANGCTSTDTSVTTMTYTPGTYVIPDTEYTPLSFAFYYNYGQVIDTRDSVRNDVSLYSLNQYPAMFVRKDTMSFVFSKINADTSSTAQDSLARVDMFFVDLSHESITGGSTKQSIVGVLAPPAMVTMPYQPVPQYLNYFLPQCPVGGITNVPGYQKLAVKNIYTGVDLLYAGNSEGLKTYIVCNPGGAAPAGIAIHFNGSDSVTVDDSGALHVYSQLGQISFKQSYAYEMEPDGSLIEKTWRPGYIFDDGGNVLFTTDSYDDSKPLIFKMERGAGDARADADNNLCWSTYYGGSDYEYGNDVQCDNSSNVYIGGETYSSDFPATVGQSTSVPSAYNSDAYIAKFDNTGVPLWSTYFGGTNDSHVKSIAINYNDDVFMCGYTECNDFPIVTLGSAYQSSGVSGTQSKPVSFVGKLDKSDGHILWTSYFSGNQNKIYTNAKPDFNNSNEDIYMVGTGANSHFPFQSSGGLCYYNTNGQGTITRFNSSSLKVTWATGFGTIGATIQPTILTGITKGDLYSVYIVGYTGEDANIPSTYTSGQYTQTYGGGNSDGLLLQFDANNKLEYSSYIGGAYGDYLNAVTSTIGDVFGNQIYIVGESSSNDFPTEQGSASFFSATNNVGTNVNPDGIFMNVNGSEQIGYSTYYGDHGGGGYYYLNNVTVSSDNHVYLVGTSYDQSGIPIVTPDGYYTQSSYPTNGPRGDIACFYHDDLYWATYFGGDQMDECLGLATDNNNNLFVIGDTRNGNTIFPLVKPNNANAYYQDKMDNNQNNGAPADAFISKFCINSVITGVKDITSNEDNIYIYPNPADQTIFIVIPLSIASNYKQIQVTNILGQRILNQPISTQIDISNLPSGMYFLNLLGDKGYKTIKFIKQ